VVVLHIDRCFFCVSLVCCLAGRAHCWSCPLSLQSASRL
jgi:hypothetical protein